MPDSSPKPTPLSRSQILIAMAVTAIVLFVVAKLWMYLFGVRIVPIRWQPVDLLLGLGLGGAITLLSSLIYQIWHQYRVAADEYLEMVLRPLELPDLIWLGLLPGMSEELLFRGVAIPGLGMNITAVVISSVVFGGLHMASPKYLPYMIWAMTVGFFLGMITLQTHNLLPAIAAHVFTNSLSGLVWKLKQRQIAS